MRAEGDGQTVLNSSTHREEIMLEVETLICLTHSAGVRNLSLSFTFIKAPLPRLEVSTEHQELFLKVPKGAWSSIKHVPLQRLANHLQSHHTSYRVSCSLRAKQSWPLANPLNDPTFMRICSLAPSREHLLAKPGNDRPLSYREQSLFLKALEHPITHYPHPEQLSQELTPHSSLHFAIATASWFVCFFTAQFAS